MSCTRLSYGYVTILENILSEEEVFELRGTLWEESNFNININYDGTLVYIDLNKRSSDPDDIYILTFSKDSNKNKFINECKKYNLKIDDSKILEYHCVWYDGADFYLDEYTKEEFIKCLENENV